MMGRWYIALLLPLFLMACAEEYSDMKAFDLRCEGMPETPVVQTTAPRLSWKLDAEGFNRSQSAYRILVASAPELLEDGKADLWDSGKRLSDRQHHIPYRGAALASRNRCFWKVMVWDDNQRPSRWSNTAEWRVGLLESTDWNAQWIGHDRALSDSTIRPKPWANGMKQKSEYRPLPSPYLRKEFTLDAKPEEAMVYITALGFYELYINGHRVGKDQLTPGWTDFHQRAFYNSYEVSDLLREGDNALAVMLADGWYAGTLANRGRNFYGNKLRAKLQLEITFRDAAGPVVISSDNTWKAAHGGVVEADMQGGQTFVEALEPTGWKQPRFDDADWAQVQVADTPALPLDAYPMPAVKRWKTLQPQRITAIDASTSIVDMGQNFAGRARISISAHAGDTVQLRFAEMLNEDGSLHTKNLRTARATDTYVSSTDAEDRWWEPQFTFHGFRYIEVSGLRRALKPTDIEGVVLSSNLAQAGTFSCSDPMLNRLHENILWSLRSNFLEVPTDCPQRDERLAWTGDAQLIAPTAAYLLQVDQFMKKWLETMRRVQFSDGGIPVTVPPVYTRTAAGWGDAAVIIPYELFQHYSDTAFIRDNFSMMRNWVDYLDSNSRNGICTLSTFGDWQNLDSETPHNLLATAYHHHDHRRMAEMANILGDREAASHHERAAKAIQRAFLDSFLLDDHRIKGHTQTAYALALRFQLLPDSLVDRAVTHLVELIRRADTSLTTGIIGTSMVLPVLSDYGHRELAYALIQRREFPSWGYQIDRGATTIWERWGGFTDTAGFYDDKTNSFNHFAFGAVGQWMYGEIAGIRALEPGFTTVSIAPRPGGSLKHATAQIDGPHGIVASHWELKGDSILLEVTIPPNSQARVSIPTQDGANVRHNGKPLEAAKTEERGGAVEVRVDSGHHRFTALYHP